MVISDVDQMIPVGFAPCHWLHEVVANDQEKSGIHGHDDVTTIETTSWILRRGTTLKRIQAAQQQAVPIIWKATQLRGSIRCRFFCRDKPHAPKTGKVELAPPFYNRLTLHFTFRDTVRAFTVESATLRYSAVTYAVVNHTWAGGRWRAIVPLYLVYHGLFPVTLASKSTNFQERCRNL